MKKVIVTGANSGLGWWTTRYLLDKNYHVVLACRDVEKANSAIKNFHANYHPELYTIAQVDMADFTSIRTFVNTLQKDEKMYGLVCNAGVSYEGPFRYTKNGIEETFGTNYVGHFLLTELLLQKFDIQRIVIVSSELHNPKNKSPFAKAALQSVKEMAYPRVDKNSTLEKQTQSFYATSKLCLVMFTYELNRRLKLSEGKRDVFVNAINPGLMLLTNLGRTNKSGENIYRWLLHGVFKLIGIADHPKDSAKAVVSLIDACTSSGKYYDKFAEIPSSEESYDEDKAKVLWIDTWKLIEEEGQ